MYADYTYYQTEYGGKMSADEYKRFGRRAERRIDGITGNKLQFAFPTDSRAVEAVRDCVCELADFLYQIDSYNAAAMERMETVAQADGTVKSKVIKSVSSGSESISYSDGGSFSTATMEAAKDKKVADAMVYGMVRDNLCGVPDANGVNLLYAGIPYPRRNAPISRPPEDTVAPSETSLGQVPKLRTFSDNEEQKQDKLWQDSVVIYNRHDLSAGGEQYYGTRFDNVRVEFTQEQNQNKSGSQDVSVCLLKIPNDSTMSKPYKDPKSWAQLTTEKMLENFTLNTDGDFFVIVKKAELNLDVEAPVGVQTSEDAPYADEGGVYEYMKGKYGYVYRMSSFAAYGLIPYFQVGGR